MYALDALRGEDRALVDQHLATCAACRGELEQLRGDTALLALSTTGPRPPQRARQRLLDAVAREARAPKVMRDFDSPFVVGMAGMGGYGGGGDFCAGLVAGEL